MMSDEDETINQFITIIAVALLIVGSILIGWFLADWVLVGNGTKPYFDVFDINSVVRPVVGMICIIGHVFGRMLEKRKIESLAKRG